MSVNVCIYGHMLPLHTVCADGLSRLLSGADNKTTYGLHIRMNTPSIPVPRGQILHSPYMNHADKEVREGRWRGVSCCDKGVCGVGGQRHQAHSMTLRQTEQPQKH